MNKTDFVIALSDRLSFLPWTEVEERINFYVEMIDDRMEEGLSEEDAVAAVGSVSEIADQILADIPFAALVKKSVKSKKRLNTWEIVLLVLGSPLWLSLGIAFFAVIFSLYAALWAIIISLWSVFLSCAVCAVCGAAACVILAIGGNIPSGIVLLAAGFVCAGLSIFIFFGCRAAAKGILILTKKTVVRIRNCFIGKVGAQ